MVLKDEVSSIIVSRMKAMIGPVKTNSTISPNELSCDPLKLTNTLPRLQRLSSYSLGEVRQVGKGGRQHYQDRPIYASSSVFRPLRLEQVHHHRA